MPVSGMTFADDLTFYSLQGSEQGSRTVAFVIVGHCAASPLLDRQPRLRAIQRLNLALFVYAQDDRLLRGFRYRPTTSVIFSRNFGSRESLKVSVRCGCRLWARQILLTVDLLTPWLCAMVRQLQCVIPAGLVCRVASTMAAILSIS